MAAKLQRESLRKPLNLALAIFWLLWAGVIIPLHARGCVPLTGVSTAPGGSVQAACSDCCCGSDNSSKPEKDETPLSRKGGNNCAICSFVAKLSAAAPVVIDLKPLGFLEFAAAAMPQRQLGEDCFHMFNSRAPPAVPAC